MTLSEMKRAIRSYGLRVPAGLVFGTVNEFWIDFLDTRPVGSGNARQYSTRQLRHLVAWLTIREVTHDGSRGGESQKDLHHQAKRLMAAASEGWVVMSEGRARWSLVEPVSALRHGAVVMPVPDWLPEHQPR